MTLKKKRKYGDLASQIADNNNDPDLIADVYAAFTGRRPREAAPDILSGAANQSGVDSQSAADSQAAADIKVVQPLPLAAAVKQSGAVSVAAAVRQSGASDLSKLLPEGPIYDKWTPTPNDITDVLQPLLKPQDYSVLTRLYRLAQGFQTNTVRVSNPRLATSCNISERDLRRVLGRLCEHGLITRLDTDFSNRVQVERGMVIQVNLPLAVVRAKDRMAGAVSLSGADKESTAVRLAPNKETHIKETHTNTGETAAVRVCSKFSLEQCRQYAESLRKEGITNPGGYATKIYRSGEADNQIARFLAQKDIAQVQTIDTTKCPDCQGTGWWYPKGRDMGAARCKHARLNDDDDNSN